MSIDHIRTQVAAKNQQGQFHRRQYTEPNGQSAGVHIFLRHISVTFMRWKPLPYHPKKQDRTRCRPSVKRVLRQAALLPFNRNSITYAITNTGFMQQQMNLDADEFSAAEIKLKPGYNLEESQTSRCNSSWAIPARCKQRYQQNSSLYNTMKTENGPFTPYFTLILIIAAFNMVSALTMLVLEKKQDMSILWYGNPRRHRSGCTCHRRPVAGHHLAALIGIGLATAICLFQLKFRKIKLTGSSLSD